MNYYDELGVRRDAPSAEIRQAYRVLVRLLHPDTQTDEELRRAAERQLSRLNAIAAVLTSPELRRAYDLQLDADASPGLPAGHPRTSPQPEQWRDSAPGFIPSGRALAQLVVRHWSFVLIGAVTCGAAVLSVLLNTQSDAPSQPAGAEAARVALAVEPASPRPKQAPPRPQPALVQTPRATPADDAIAQVASPKPRIRPAELTQPKVESTLPSQSTIETPGRTDALPPPQERPQKATLSPAAAAASPSASFAGNWFYTADLDSSQETSGYRAVYVELLLSQSGDTLSGNYRARYLIPDKAISPQVSFHLEGKVSPNQTARVTWTAANGAKGEADLTLSPRGVMDLHWWSTEIAERTGLSSGSARLIRQRAP